MLVSRKRTCSIAPLFAKASTHIRLQIGMNTSLESVANQEAYFFFFLQTIPPLQTRAVAKTL